MGILRALIVFLAMPTALLLSQARRRGGDGASLGSGAVSWLGPGGCGAYPHVVGARELSGHSACARARPD